VPKSRLGWLNVPHLPVLLMPNPQQLVAADKYSTVGIITVDEVLTGPIIKKCYSPLLQMGDVTVMKECIFLIM